MQRGMHGPPPYCRTEATTFAFYFVFIYSKTYVKTRIQYAKLFKYCLWLYGIGCIIIVCLIIAIKGTATVN